MRLKTRGNTNITYSCQKEVWTEIIVQLLGSDGCKRKLNLNKSLICADLHS